MQRAVANIKIENHDTGDKVNFPLILSSPCNYKQSVHKKKCSNEYEQSICENCNTIIQNCVYKGHVKYTCQLCSTIIIKSQVETHLKLHDFFVYFSCKYCTFKCLEKEELELHLEGHADVIQYNDNLIQHHNQSLKRKEILSSRKHIWNEKVIFPKDFACHLCNSKYSHKRSLRKHLLSDHKLGNSWTFQCNICDFKHDKKNYVKWHLINVHKIKDVDGWNKIIKSETSS